jgi:hypothetical protein
MNDDQLNLAVACVSFGILAIVTLATFLLVRLVRPPKWKRNILRRRREDAALR